MPIGFCDDRRRVARLHVLLEGRDDGAARARPVEDDEHRSQRRDGSRPVGIK